MAEPFGGRSEAGIGFASSAVALLLALAVFPANPSPPGALTVPALILTAGILLVPVSRAIRRSPDLLGADNLVAFGYVFWLLLDLIQGAYDLRDAPDWAIRDAFIAVGVSASVMWIGVAGRPWKLPNWLGEIASRPMDTRTIAQLVPLCFVLGMFNFAYATSFDVPRMFSYLGESRWSAPWGRGQLGGWNAFADQLQYFGYVLPSLTALLIAGETGAEERIFADKDAAGWQANQKYQPTGKEGARPWHHFQKAACVDNQGRRKLALNVVDKEEHERLRRCVVDQMQQRRECAQRP